MEWRERITEASRLALPATSWATEAHVAVTLFYFPADKMEGDIDNIVKPVLDALAPHLYLDDSQVDRILVQRFELGGSVFESKSYTCGCDWPPETRAFYSGV